ncbi:SDR family NAD(P)-dependent oxidoreductase [Phytohabitans suffuscus]|uniref:Oxidoreductase n=1 Tax=Phytohabitans suffuscus TaxID=624315 RepID=A0A6F8Z033_9ACTN|nr:SDR family oxidoreductase [Phytohabitans suffuscus]BCB91747.1 oxidoreductase [Phytohabitans suffuscus]
MRIRDSVALVTGASSGIGWASAVRLAGAGARVLVHGRDEGRLAALADLVDGVPLTGELADPGQVDRLAAAALGAAGRVDIVVHNAGAGWAGPFDRMPEADIGRLVAVNLAAPIGLTRALLPGMRARGEGHLMFVTSIAGRVGVAGEAVYAATKAGLDAFAESLRLELRGSGVGVGALAPGVVQTRFFERRGQPYGRDHPRPIPADRVAAALVRAVAEGRDDGYVPGWLRLPVAVRGVAPGLYRRLAGRFGGS